MKPYFAVIADSFHAAFSSRVLWIAILAIWLLLAALAPIGYREDFTTNFLSRDFYNGTRLKAMLAQGLADESMADKPIGRIAAAMPKEIQTQLRRVAEGEEVRIRLSKLADGLNEMLDDESWYDAEAWDGTLRFRELRELDAQSTDQLDESLRQRRARLRLEAALPGVFEARSVRSIKLTYAGLDFPAGLAIDKPQFVSLVNQIVLPTIIDWLLGFILIFLGILVTASVIPDMLEPGSLHLLLSKPISRTGLLLAKFFGGCAFVVVCVTQLVIGLYLIAGLRLDVWNVRLMWCIPVAAFLFSIFYSVSALAAIRWRSPILSIGLTCLFGAVCLVTGVVGGLFDGLVTMPARVDRLAVAGEVVFATTEGGGMNYFDPQSESWVEIYEGGPTNNDRVLPPVAIDRDTVVTAQISGGRFNPFGGGPVDLSVIRREQGWDVEPGKRLPTAAADLRQLGPGTLMAINTAGLFTADVGEILGTNDRPANNQSNGDGAAAASWFSKLSNMMGGEAGPFVDVLPDTVSITPPRAIAVSPAGDRLGIYSRGQLTILRAPPDPTAKWEISMATELDVDPGQAAVIAFGNRRILVAIRDQPIQILDRDSLEILDTVIVADGVDVLQATEIGGDRFVIRDTDGEISVVGQAGETWKVNRIGYGDVETVLFDSESNRLYVAHSIDRIDALDVETWASQRSLRPRMKRWRFVDRYVITPLRTIIPQTGELGQTVTLLISGESSFSFSNGDGDDEVVRYQIARPLISCSVFLVVMLTIGCVYFATRDF